MFIEIETQMVDESNKIKQILEKKEIVTGDVKELKYLLFEGLKNIAEGGVCSIKRISR